MWWKNEAQLAGSASSPAPSEPLGDGAMANEANGAMAVPWELISWS